MNVFQRIRNSILRWFHKPKQQEIKWTHEEPKTILYSRPIRRKSAQEWCHDFNVTLGWITPEKSPISHYFKTKPRRKHVSNH